MKKMLLQNLSNSGAVDLADFALHPYRANLAQKTMRLLR